MSDNDPNFKLNRKRMQVEALGLQLNIQRYELRLMEIEDEKAKIAENIDSSLKRISEIEKLTV